MRNGLDIHSAPGVHVSRPILAEYVRAGWKLVPIPLGEKGPTQKDWTKKLVEDPETAEYLDGNIGLAHLESGTCCVDLDDLEEARRWLSERGIDVDALLTAADSVRISSGRPNRAKLLFKAPHPLPSFKLGGLELRCMSLRNTSLQDVLPPSIHPDTGNPYVWEYGDDLIGHWSNPPPLPPELLTLWEGLARRAPKPTQSATQARKEVKLPDVQAMIDGQDPNAGYDDWIKVGMAIHHGTGGSQQGLELWDQWSAKGAKYKGVGDLETHWRSFRLDLDVSRTLDSLRLQLPASTDEFEAYAGPAPVVPGAKASTPRMPDGVHLRRDKTGKALAVLANVEVVLATPAMSGLQLSKDTFKDAIMVAPEGTQDWRTFRDTDYTSIRLWLETTGNFYPVARDLVRDAVHYISEHNQMDTAQTWLNSLEWDGKKRIEKFMPNYMGTVDAAYERAVGVYLWTALAGRVVSPGCQVDMVPVLVGAGGIGKSQGVKAIAPSIEFYAEVRLDDSDDNAARKLRGVLVGEIAEMKGLRTGEYERIKAFITRTHEQWIPKYQEFATTYARRLAMIGTVNDEEFLPDGDDGDRRWLPVRTVGVNVEAIRRDRDQLWAEAYQLYLELGIQWGGVQEHAAEARSAFRPDDPWASMVQEWIAAHPDDKLRLSDVLIQAVGLDARHVKRADQLRLGKILRGLGYDRVVARIDGDLTRVWAKVAEEAKP